MLHFPTAHDDSDPAATSSGRKDPYVPTTTGSATTRSCGSSSSTAPARITAWPHAFTAHVWAHRQHGFATDSLYGKYSLCLHFTRRGQKELRSPQARPARLPFTLETLQSSLSLVDLKFASPNSCQPRIPLVCLTWETIMKKPFAIEFPHTHQTHPQGHSPLRTTVTAHWWRLASHPRRTASPSRAQSSDCYQRYLKLDANKRTELARALADVSLGYKIDHSAFAEERLATWGSQTPRP